MKIYNYLLDTIETKGGVFLILLDPDKISEEKTPFFLNLCEQSGVDGFLVGGSLMINSQFEHFIEIVKVSTSLPVIIFPGSINQVSGKADALLFLSVVSGRNSDHLIGQHVLASPIIKKLNIEPISTGYMLIESGAVTAVQYMSGSMPIPRKKSEIAASTALAAQFLGMKLIYLEAGSGAEKSVPNDMVNKVSQICDIPIIVGGGIRTVDCAKEKMNNGANIIVTGNLFEHENNWDLLKDFASVIHSKTSITV